MRREKSTMAANDESPGLKIAVAAFISLSVILAITSYFLYAKAAADQARLAAQRDAEQAHRRVANMAVNQFEQITARIGTRTVEFDSAKDEIAASFKKVEDRLSKLSEAVVIAIQAAQQNGAEGAELENAKLGVQKAIASYRNEKTKTYIGSLDRLTELSENLAAATADLSREYVRVRKNLDEGAGAAKSKQDKGSGNKN
jgi:hypothetical protein